MGAILPRTVPHALAEEKLLRSSPKTILRRVGEMNYLETIIERDKLIDYAQWEYENNGY